MKLGYQTIIWGPRIDDLRGVLAVIREAGFQGVEFAQRWDMLSEFGDRLDIERLLSTLQAYGLTLLGLAGGTLQERMKFCGSYRPEYLYVEDWDPNLAPSALSSDPPFTLALHPHYFKTTHRLSDAKRVLDEHPGLKWLPDTAHVTVAGDDPVAAIRLAPDRLAAVHLKDWTPVYGRSSHRYARGFTELGHGTVDLDSVLHGLRAMSYQGWLVAEQDSSRIEPQTSVLDSAEWLASRGFLPAASSRGLAAGPQRSRTAGLPFKKCPIKDELRFVRSTLQASTEDVGKSYNSVAAAFSELVPCHLVSVWACSPAQRVLSLLAVYPASVKLEKHVLRTSEVLSGVAVERQAVTHFDLTSESPGRLYGRPEVQFAAPEVIPLGVKWMVSVPVFNSYNQNHVRLVVNLFPKEHPLRTVSDEDLLWFGMDVARATDSVVDEVCSDASARTNLLAAQSKRSDDFLDSLVLLIREVVGCEGSSIFLVNPAGNRLEVRAHTELEWHVAKGEQFYRKGEGLTGKVWERNEVIMTMDTRQEPGGARKSSEVVKTPEYTCLLAPLATSGGKVIGVVRCRNKRVDVLGGSNMFSDDDAAVIDAISQAAVPHLQALLSEEQRAAAIGALQHQLSTPLATFRAVIEIMKEELERRGAAPTDVFGKDYLEELRSPAELMRGVLRNALFYGPKTGSVLLKATPTELMADAIVPAIRQVDMLLGQRGFSAQRIHCEGFDKIPPLWVDRIHFQQVVFNLLSNAIRYAADDAEEFRVTIDASQHDERFVLRFEDWGTGIQAGLEEAIFQEWVRGPSASDLFVAGQGLGLAITRRIVEAHGGGVCVTNLEQPTEVTVFLPASLAERPPGVNALTGE